MEKYNVTAIGNAIVDVLAKCDDEFLGKKGITKGAMNLVDEKRSNDLLNSIDQPQIISGGSAANTAVGLSMLGSKTNFIGKVKDDELGNLFINDIRNAGVSFKTNPTSSGPNTSSIASIDRSQPPCGTGPPVVDVRCAVTVRGI